MYVRMDGETIPNLPHAMCRRIGFWRACMCSPSVIPLLRTNELHPQMCNQMDAVIGVLLPPAFTQKTSDQMNRMKYDTVFLMALYFPWQGGKEASKRQG
jgi:hypothetical protein